MKILILSENVSNIEIFFDHSRSVFKQVENDPFYYHALTFFFKFTCLRSKAISSYEDSFVDGPSEPLFWDEFLELLRQNILSLLHFIIIFAVII